MTSDLSARRSYFPSFEDAARDFKLPVENMRVAREVAARVPHSEVYIPVVSRAYIALVTPESKRMAASIHSGFAWLRDDVASLVGDLAEKGDGWWGVTFPVNSLRAGGSSKIGGGTEIAPPTCDGCSMQLPRTGLCDNCDD